jgi:hypothetical protein
MHKKRHSPDDSDDEELASTSLFDPNGDSSQNVFLFKVFLIKNIITLLLGFR